MIGAVALLAALPDRDRARPAHRDGAHRHLREAARDRPHDDPRAADVRDRGRRDAPDPADRRAAAARELRGVEPHRDVRHARPADQGVVGTAHSRRPAAVPDQVGREGARSVDRRIRRLGFGLVGLFALLFAQLSYVQVINADHIKAQPANARRQIIAEYKVERGPILSADGVVLARSERSPQRRAELRFERRYTDGPLYAALTGYYSRTFGRAGLEEAANPYLSGDAPDLAISTFTDLILGRDRKGGAIDTTIVTDLQRAADEALGNQSGRGRRGRSVDRRRARARGQPQLRPERDLVGIRRRHRRGMGIDQRRPGEAIDLARQGRAVPSGFHRQAHHRVGGARGRSRTRRVRSGRTRGSSTCRRPRISSRNFGDSALQRRLARRCRWPRRSRNRATSRSPRSVSSSAPAG